MGLFKRILFECPKCQGGMEVQSKVGEGEIGTYFSHEVPVEIAEDIEGETVRCDTCERSWQVVEIPKQRKTTRMGLVRG